MARLAQRQDHLERAEGDHPRVDALKRDVDPASIPCEGKRRHQGPEGEHWNGPETTSDYFIHSPHRRGRDRSSWSSVVASRDQRQGPGSPGSVHRIV